MNEPEEKNWPHLADPGSHQRARRQLADSVRTLIDRCLCTEASEEDLVRANALLGEALSVLGDSEGGSFVDGIASGDFQKNPVVYADRNTVLGKANPLAPPMELESDGEWLVGRVRLGHPYEGAPGFVHGGVISSMMDQLFGSLTVRLGVPALTGKLTVRYRRPTPIGVTLWLRARISRTVGRRSRCEGWLSHEDTVLVEADAMMIAVEKTHLNALFGVSNQGPGEGTP